MTSTNGDVDYYYGQGGINTLDIVLTSDQWALPAVQNDLANYAAFLATNPGVNQTHTFHFGASSGAMTVAGWQYLNIQIAGQTTIPATTGVEGSPIALNLASAVATFPGAGLTSLVVSAIPVGATLSDGAGGHSFTASGANTSVDVHAWTLSSLTITPPNDTNFMLSIAVTKTEGGGSVTTTGTESVTVDPTAPTVTSATVSGVEGTAIPLNLASEIAATGLSGDSNTLNSVTLTFTVASGDSYKFASANAGLNQTFAAGAGQTLTLTAAQLAAGVLSDLSITPANASSNVSLAISATEQGGDGNVSAAATGTESVTVDPTAPTVTSATASGVEGTAIPLNLASEIAATGLSGDSNTLNSVTLAFTVASGDSYKFASANAGLNQTFAAGAGQTLTLTAAQLAAGVLSDLSITPANASSNVSLAISATEQGGDGNVSAAATGTESVTVDPTAPTVTSATVSGVEGTAIPLNLASEIAATGLSGDSNTLNSVTLAFTVASGDSYKFASANAGLNQTFAAGAGQTLTLTAAQLAAGVLSDLSITPANASSNVSLAISATEQGGDGNVSAAATGTESVTVDPTAPTVTSATVSGVEGTAIPLNLASEIAATGLSGDSNTLNSVTLTFTVASGDSYKFASANAGLNQTFAAGAGQTLTLTAAQLAAGVLSDLSITPANASSNVSLAISATEQGGDGNVSAAATGTESVTVDPTAPTVTSATASGVEGTAIPLNLASEIAATGLSGDSNTLNSVTLAFTVASGDSYKFASANAGLNQTFAAGAGQTLTLTAAQLAAGVLSDLSITPANASSNVSLAISATEQGGDGNVSAAATGTESVTVDPLAPTVVWSVGSMDSIKKNKTDSIGTLTISANSLTGDTNTITSETISGTGTSQFNGSLLADDSSHSVAANSSGTIPSTSVASWDLAHALTFKPPNTQNLTYTLTASATETDANGDTSTNSATLTLTTTPPAGTGGAPINLALKDLANEPGDLVAVTIAGLPVDWNLNAGTNNGDGSWTVQTNDPASLTVTTPNSFAGAEVLNVTESWTNADGSTGTAIVADNVEAYSPNSPIFALSGDDSLTGAGSNDEFVFAQPIGNDTVYNFNAVSDQIDLIGFSNVASFSDIQAGIANDAKGDAVITLGTGETITLVGADAASLSASNFIFNQEPTTNNSGAMTISNGAMLPLGGTIDNTGTIALNSTGDETDLEVLVNSVTLQGGGQVTLSDNSENVIFGGASSATLTNVDNTISGAGQIGQGQMTLANEGTIDANGTNALTIDTGSNVVSNSGTLEATGSGGLVVNSAVANSGSLIAAGGDLTLKGDVTGAGTATISGGGDSGIWRSLVRYDDLRRRDRRTEAGSIRELCRRDFRLHDGRQPGPCRHRFRSQHDTRILGEHRRDGRHAHGQRWNAHREPQSARAIQRCRVCGCSRPKRRRLDHLYRPDAKLFAVPESNKAASLKSCTGPRS